MPYVILEKEFDPPLTEDAHDSEAERLDPCLQVHGVHWIRSYVSTDRRRMICEFEAADAEALRGAMRSAGVPFSRIWAAEEYRPGGGARGSWVERRQARASGS